MNTELELTETNSCHSEFVGVRISSLLISDIYEPRIMPLDDDNLQKSAESVDEVLENDPQISQINTDELKRTGTKPGHSEFSGFTDIHNPCESASSAESVFYHNSAIIGEDK